MNTELYNILNTIFDLGNPLFNNLLEKVDYVGYEKTVFEKGRHYINQYNDTNDMEINFGVTDEAIDNENNYAYLYVKDVYDIDTKLFPDFRETVTVKLVLCSFKQDIENHARDLLIAIVKIFQERRALLPSVFEFNSIGMNLNKEKIFSEETARDNERMTSNNYIHLATFEFRITYYYNVC